MRISRQIVATATFSVLAVAGVQAWAFDQSTPGAPAPGFGPPVQESVNSVFHSFVPPAASSVAPAEATPEADLKAYRDGSKAYEQGDFATARKNWELLAKRGDVFAQWQLGNMYRKGLGVPVDHAKAFRYYELVAAQHEDVGRYTAKTRVTVDAIVQLANYYEEGLKDAGVARNVAYAQKLYHGTATHFRHPGAQYHLGKMYLAGEGVNRSIARGLRWLNLAAQKRYAPAQAALGEVYWDGEGVKADRSRGLMWYMLAQESADPAREQPIIERFHELLAAADEKDRQRAQSLVGVWNERYPDKGR